MSTTQPAANDASSRTASAPSARTVARVTTIVVLVFALATFVGFVLRDGGAVLFTVLMAWFASIAMEPAVARLSKRMRRGAATGLVMLVGHYTEGPGLLSILANNVLWATASGYLNDTSEVELGNELLLERFAALADARHPSFSDLRDRLAESDVKQGPSPGWFFILSASTSPDSLAMWRSYGGRGESYAIGLDPAAEQALLLIKHPGFREEQETRRTTVVFGEGTRAEALTGVARFRHTAYGMAPYLRLTGTSDAAQGPVTPVPGPLPIRAVAISPTPNGLAAEESLLALLHSQGMPHVPVRRSGIPFRG